MAVFAAETTKDEAKEEARTVPAAHGLRAVESDPEFEAGLTQFLLAGYDRKALIELYGRFQVGEGAFDHLMRRAIWRAVARRFGDGVRIAPGASFRHLETLEIGNGVSIGAQACIQGRFDGTCSIGNRVWIGPQAYLDARDLIIEDDVGFGHGAKVLGSQHTALPIDVPIIQTDLVIQPVRIQARADVGVGTVVLPGVTIGADSIVGAGAVVTRDVAPFSIVAGVPARFLRWRDGYSPQATA